MMRGIDHYRVGLEQLDALCEPSDVTEHGADRLAERVEQQRSEILEEQRRSAESNGFQTGVFAVYQGRTYPASQPPAVDSRITLTAPDDEAARELQELDADPEDATGRTRFVRLAEVEQWYRWGYFNYVLNGGYEVALLLRTLTDLTEERVDLLLTSVPAAARSTGKSY